MNLNNTVLNLTESEKNFSEFKQNKYIKQNQKINICKTLSSEILERNSKAQVDKKIKNLVKKINVVSKSSLNINEIGNSENSLKKTYCVFHSSLDSKQRQLKENLLFKSQEPKIENAQNSIQFEKNRKNINEVLFKPPTTKSSSSNCDVKTKNTFATSESYFKTSRDLPKISQEYKSLNKQNSNEKSFDSASTSSSCSPHDFLLVNTCKNVMSGWLKVTKYGSNIFSRIPVRRWFMLSDEACHLFSFRSEQDYKPIDEINLAKSVLSFKTTQMGFEDSLMANNRVKNSFEIRSKGILYVLEAGSAKEVLGWMRMLQTTRKNFLEKVENTEYSVIGKLNTANTASENNLKNRSNNDSMMNDSAIDNENSCTEDWSEKSLNKFDNVKHFISQSIIKSKASNCNIPTTTNNIKTNNIVITDDKKSDGRERNEKIGCDSLMRDLKIDNNLKNESEEKIGLMNVVCNNNKDNKTIKTATITTSTATTTLTNNFTNTTANNNNNNNKNHHNKIFPFLKLSENKKVSPSFFKFGKKESAEKSNNQPNNTKTINVTNSNNTNNNDTNHVNNNNNKKHKKKIQNNASIKIKKGNSFFFTRISDNTETEFTPDNTLKKAASLDNKQEGDLHHYDVLELPVNNCINCQNLSLELKTLQHDRQMLTEELAASHKSIQDLNDQLQIKDTLLNYWKDYFKKQRLNDESSNDGTVKTAEHCGKCTVSNEAKNVPVSAPRCIDPCGNNDKTDVNGGIINTNNLSKYSAPYLRKSFSLNKKSSTLKQPINSRTLSFFVNPFKNNNSDYEEIKGFDTNIKDLRGGDFCRKIFLQKPLYSKINELNKSTGNFNNINEKNIETEFSHNKLNNDKTNNVYKNDNIMNNKTANSNDDSSKEEDNGYSFINFTKDKPDDTKNITSQKYETIDISYNYDNINYNNSNNNDSKNKKSNTTTENEKYEEIKTNDTSPAIQLNEGKKDHSNDDTWFVFDKNSFSVEERALEWYKDERDAFITQNSILNEEIYQLNRCFGMMDKRQDETEIEKTRLQAETYKLKSNIVKTFKVLMDLCRGGSLTISEDKLNEILVGNLKCDLKNYNIEGLEAKFDKYGFEKEFRSPYDMFNTQITRSNDDNARNILDFYPFKRRQMEEVPSSRWESMLISMEVSLASNTLNCTDSEYKHLIRLGVPDGLRARLWKVCIDRLIRPYRSSKKFMEYPDLLNLIHQKKVILPLATQIELDLYRTLPNNMHFSTSYSAAESASKIDSLRNILQAFSIHNPMIGYCQGLNRIVAVLLLLLEEEEAYWGLVAMVELVMPANYYDKTLLGAHIDQRVLKDLVVDKLPNLTAHFASLGFDHSLFTFPWFITIFVDNFPIEASLKIWDSFLLEGDKVLFRYALAVMKYFEEGLLNCKSINELNHFVRGMCAKVHQTNKLSQIAFCDLNPFSYKTIRNKRKIYKQTMTKELKEIEKLRNQFIKSTSFQDSEKGIKNEDQTIKSDVMNYHKLLTNESSNEFYDSF